MKVITITWYCLKNFDGRLFETFLKHRKTNIAKDVKTTHYAD